MAEATTVELDAQYRQLREECGLLDRSGRGKLLLRGAEAAEYLQGQLTNDVEGLEPGEGCYAALLDRKGHMQSDMRVLDLSGAPYVPIGGIKRTGTEGEQAIWIDTEPEPLPLVRRHLETYKIGREVELEDVTGARAILSLIGPRSADLAGAPPLPEHVSEAIAVGGTECLAVGTAGGIDLIAAADDAGRLRAALGDADAVEVGPEAVEILRIEAGTPRFGAEMDGGTMPAEAGIVESAVDFEKGCYIGQETVARLHYRGKPNRHLRGLRLSAPVPAGAALALGDKEVGRVGSSCVSPLHGPIALAVLRREAEPGAELAVGEDGVTARVVDLPFG
ncbi:MAG TPA: glycine cleavage T C-terminal barrel domain-containing protein [Solirubrobacterales bacterium]|jgi:folate-binding protein YgfZ